MYLKVKIINLKNSHHTHSYTHTHVILQTNFYLKKIRTKFQNTIDIKRPHMSSEEKVYKGLRARKSWDFSIRNLEGKNSVPMLWIKKYKFLTWNSVTLNNQLQVWENKQIVSRQGHKNFTSKSKLSQDPHVFDYTEKSFTFSVKN